jgi:hypothetical protein
MALKDKKANILDKITINLVISKGESIRLKLMDKKRFLGEVLWNDETNLSRNLLKKIDALLRKNKVSLDKISSYKIISDVPDNWTTYRIAKITMESLMLAKKIGL